MSANSETSGAASTAMGRIRSASRVVAPALLVPPAVLALGALLPQAASAAPPAAAVVQHHGAAAFTEPKVPVDEELLAYFNAGYDYDDAVVLARYWNDGSPYQAKLDTGEALIKSGDKFKAEFQHGDTAWTVSDDFARAAYFNNGYDYADARRLAKVWHQTDISTVKATAGRKILAGIKLPA
ncbi:MAG: hypothetical protein JXA67_02400 [Micromonosporaceae bacterium]|nr:hypothetical protein [Micromonosporaceae bacterium]